MFLTFLTLNLHIRGLKELHSTIIALGYSEYDYGFTYIDEFYIFTILIILSFPIISCKCFCKTSLVVMDSVTFACLERLYFFFHFLRIALPDIFFADSLFIYFFPSTVNMSSHSLLSCTTVSAEKCTDSVTGIPVYVM